MVLKNIKLNDFRGEKLKYPEMKYLLGGSSGCGSGGSGGSDDEWCCAFYYCLNPNGTKTGYGGFFYGCYEPHVLDLCSRGDILSAPQPCGS